MKFSFILFLVLLISFSSCKKKLNKSISTENSAKELKTNNQTEENFTSKDLKIELNDISKEVVIDWLEYQNIAEFVPKYYKTTTKEALFNSQRLVELTQQLKDTIRVKKFDIPSFRTRLNILHNEALRLADMDSITSITNQEIVQENKNIINAFYAINKKINSLVNKEKLENDLKEFDYLFASLDTIKKETNTKKKTKKRKPKTNRKKLNKRILPLSKKIKKDG